MNNLYLAHHGILGQKWGVRRFQNEDGTLTAAGKDRYKTDKVANNVGRAITNTAVGQRLAVNLNKGYRTDKKEIKAEYNKRKQETFDSSARKQLKSDYKKTLAEARTSAADAIYKHQSHAANQRIQSSSLGKQIGKSILMGGYGALTYDRLKANGTSKGEAIAKGLISGYGDMLIANFTGGAVSLSAGDYVYNKYYKR